MNPKYNFSTAGIKLKKEELGEIKKLIGSYAKKLSRTNCQELSIRLRKSRHGKVFLHEIEGIMEAGKKIFTAKEASYNPYEAISRVIDKLLNEEKHKERTPRQIKFRGKFQ